jgi:hypothetical protein
MSTQADSEIAAPQYNTRALEFTIAIAGLAGTLLGLVWQQPAVHLRVIAGISVLVGALMLTHIPFATKWLLCQIARSRRYASLLDAKIATEDRLAKLRAKYALATGATPLAFLAFFSEEEQTVLLFARNNALNVESGEYLYIVDDVQCKYRGTAEVTTADRKIVYAKLGDADALFKGYLRDRIAAHPGMTCQAPESVVGLRESDIEARYDALREAMEESQDVQTY